MFNIITNSIIIKNLMPQHKQFINSLLNNKTKFDFNCVTIIDSCHKTSSNFINIIVK